MKALPSGVERWLQFAREGEAVTSGVQMLRLMMALLLTSWGVTAGAAVTLSLSPTTVAFGSQTTGTTSAAKTVTVTNTGTTAGTVTVSITGGGAAVFRQTNTCTSALANRQTCTVSVTFAPTTATASSATLSVAAAGATTRSTALSGTGVAPSTVTATLTPSALTFASTNVGATSAAQTVTLKNTGTGTLTVSSIGFSGTSAGSFSQTNTCTAGLTAGKTCTLSVSFKPTATGAASATLSVASNAAGSPTTVALSGTGTAVAASYTLTPTALTFASQAVGSTSAVQSVTLKNTGTAALSVTSAVLSGTNAVAYVLTNGCTAALVANASCTLGLAFRPTATGSATATLTVTAGGIVTTASLTGTATAAVAGLRALPAVYTTGKAIAYGPYRAGGPGVGEVPTDAQLLQDLALFQSAGYNLIRLFGADGNSGNILRLIAANYPTMSVQLGIYLEGAPATCVDAVNSAQISTAITLANTYPQVVALSVGNETSLANNLPVTCLQSYVQQVRAGVTQPITADDTTSFYSGRAANGEKPDTILPYLDFASVHSYPTLNPNSWDWQQLATPTGPGRATAMMNAALTFTKNEVAAVGAYAFTNSAGTRTTIGATMPVVIGETGWKANWTNPNSSIELYTATPINAKAYLDLLTAWKGTAGAPTAIFYFDGFDEAWKGTDDGWGLWDATRMARYALCGVVAAAGACNTPDPYIGIGYYP
jgi:exo-beta-1,3-glucanase (GH17 family)